jgi:tetratricopeptide (TPR) repeat protein
MKTRPQIFFSIPIGSPVQRDRNPAKGFCRLCGILALAMLFHAVDGVTAQQTATTQGGSAESSKTPSPFREAENLLVQGQIAAAREEIQEQLKAHPTSIVGYNLLGITYSDEKNYAAALEAFQQALKLDPRSTRTLNNLGNVHVAQGKNDLGEKEFRKVISIEPDNRDGNYNLGLLLLAKDSPAEAILHLRRVHPPDIETRLALTRAYFKAGKTVEGLQAARELSAQDIDDVKLHSTLGVVLAQQKQYTAAALELEKANALQPETFEILYDLGETHLRSGEYGKAELELNRALKLKPNSPETLYLLGQAAAEQKRPVDAMDLLLRAHKLAPENADIIFLLARTSMSQNYFEDAIPLLEAGLKAAPQRADLRAALGESYFMSGKVEAAVAEFQKLIELDPTARSYAFMGLSYRHLGRFDEAMKYFQEGRKRDPRNVSCLFNVGFIEERQGNNARAEELFQETLRINPDFPEALLELANLRIASKRFEEAEVLLRKYVRVSRDPATGYYKLAMAERSLHQTAAAQRDLSVFQTFSKNAPTGPYPYQHLFEYLDNRSNLAPEARTQLDLTNLADEIRKHPDQPQNLYLLAEAYLKLGKFEEAKSAVAQLDQISAGDYRTQAGVGVLLARFHRYDEAIAHFVAALAANPDSDDVKFDLADAYFRKGRYADALSTARQVSAAGQQDDTFLALLGDIQAHLGDAAQATEIFHSAIKRNPDADQYYLSLALAQLRGDDIPGAEQTLQQGLARIPSSGKILWGLGVVSVLQGKNEEAAARFERAVDLLPEWPGSYSTLGVFYFQTGEIAKAREVLDRFKGSGMTGGLDINRIEQTLANAPASAAPNNQPMPMAARYQFFQLALSFADRTL